MAKRHADDDRTLSRAYDIYDPWLAADTSREPWILTGPSGKEYQLMLPLGAAVELEEKGFTIRAGWVQYGARGWFGEAPPDEPAPA